MSGSAPRSATLILSAGVLLVAISTGLYSYEETSMNFITPALAAVFAQIAYLYLGVTFFGCVLVAVGLRGMLANRVAQMNSKGVAPLSPGWIVPYVLSQRRFWRYFVGATVVYGVFYAFVTSIIVYQPGVDFAQAYHAAIPSLLIGPCCGPPLYAPTLTVYVVNHLGLLIVPLTMILLLTVSVLVGLNFALAAFAFDNRVKSLGRGWLGGLGAAVGLFTGCPTCAGLFFANLVGGAGAVSFAAALSYYQPVFVALSIPVLVVTPFLISRSLSRVFTDGCVVIGGARRPQAPVASRP